MSAPRMIIEVGRLMVEADEAGRLAVVSRARPERGLLRAVDIGECRVDGSVDLWTSREVSVDADEIAVDLVGPSLRLTLRHGFAAGWTTRLLVVNTGPTVALVERLQLSIRPASGCRTSALAAGSRLCWALQAGDGTGPVLAARLTAGAVTAATDAGLELGPLRLAAGQRYVAQLRWDLLATPRSIVAGPGLEVLVARTTYEVGEAVLLPDDPDAALVVPSDVQVDAVDDPVAAGCQVWADEPGRRRIELRSAEGDIRLDLGWVRALPAQLHAWAAAVLERPRTSAGVVAVEDLPAAIVVQAALGTGSLDGAEDAADALDRLTARLLDRQQPVDPVEPFEVLYLLGEHGRTGDTDVLVAALERESALLDVAGPPPPGLGLAVLRTALAGVDRRAQVAPLIARAVHRAQLSAGQLSGVELEADPGRLVAELELLLAVRPLLREQPATQQRLAGLVAAAGAMLGSGLPGRPLDPLPVGAHAHVVAVLRMLPEDGLPSVTRSWGATPSLLTHRWALEAIDRLSEDAITEQVGAAAGWLALVHRHA